MSEEYENNNYNQYYQVNDPTPSETGNNPSHNNSPVKSHQRIGRIAKKAGAITLSAMLFGGVAGCAFLAVNELGRDKESLDNNANQNTTSSTSLIKQTATPATGGTSSISDVTSIATSCMPSVVAITSKSVQEVQNYFNLYGFNGQPQTQETESCGSGIIIGENDSELLIVTNQHVVTQADTISVCFIDNTAYEGVVKGTDSDNDLAVIAVPLEDISEETLSQIAVASIGDSSALQVGEQVVAIGNALGYGQSVTTGIVSATNRSISEDSEGSAPQTPDANTTNTDTSTYIQTDAAINPGNSGGALLNMKGEVVGINTAKIAYTEVEGMGYAIPISQVSETIENLMNQETRTKVAEDKQGTLGIKGFDVDSSVSSAYGIPEGVYVSEIISKGAADNAGITAKSVITKLNGQSISGINDLKEKLTYYSQGESVEITVKVPAGNSYEEKTFTVILEAAEQ